MPDQADNEERSTSERLKSIEASLVAGEKRMDLFERGLSENTAATLTTNAITSDIRDILIAAKVGLKVIGAIGTIAKWVAILVSACAAIYSAIYAMTHGGIPPPN